MSDIHGNREALEAVLEHAHGRHDQILCLGDLVGYGADPNFVVEWARSNVAAIIRGNHDRVAVADDDQAAYRAEAQDSTQWTRKTLTPENRDYLQKLPRGPFAFEKLTLVHGSPLDEDQYLRTIRDVAPLVPSLGTALTFFGHTHVQGGFVATDGGLSAVDPTKPLEIQPGHSFYLVNPGSVGQPRDENWRAAYALYSPEEQVVEFERCSYPVGKTAEKIVLAGLPAMLAGRLLMGK